MAKSNKKRPVNHPGNPAAAAKKSQAREEAATLARKTKKKQQARKAMIQGGIGAGVVVLVIAVAVVVLLNQDGSDPATAGGPAQVTAEGSFVVGNPDAEITIQLVEDFQCPACQAFEEATGDQLAEYAAGDDVKIEYRSIAFLDRASTTNYSSRALNASACMMSEGEDTWLTWHELMFERQPPEGGDGLTDAQLADIAEDAGADRAEQLSCIEDTTYADWVEATTEQASDDGINSTPSVFVDGEEVEQAELIPTVEEKLAS